MRRGFGNPRYSRLVRRSESVLWRRSLRYEAALRFSPRRAPPLPIFRTRAQPRCHGIIPDVASDSGLFLLTANPVVVGFGLPERFFAQVQDFPGTARGELLPGFQSVVGRVTPCAPRVEPGKRRAEDCSPYRLP
jgi:hypothetical protein